MADRYPLIANSSANQIQELATGDNIDLTGNNIVGVVSITATGNVTIGGTLTYEDVTNQDVIGLATFRSGLQFGAAGVGGTISAAGNAELVGIVTAGKGLRATTGGLVVTAGIATFGAIATFTADAYVDGTLTAGLIDGGSY